MNVPRGYWNDLNNQKLFMDVTGRDLGVTTLSDWYVITPEQLLSNGGTGLIGKRYRGSMINCLRAVYPEHTWLDGSFTNTTVRKGYWASAVNRAHHTRWLAESLGIFDPAGWYSYDTAKFTALGGRNFLQRCYNKSLKLALQEAYPEHEWLEWLLPRYTSRDFWASLDNQRRFVEWTGKQLGVMQLEDWYHKYTPENLAPLGSFASLHPAPGRTVCFVLFCFLFKLKRKTNFC